MKTRAFPSIPTLAILLFAGFALTGCRTYGGYGSEEAAVAQIHQANERFAKELDRARSDVEILQTLASAHRNLASYVEEYQGVVEEHAALLEAHRATYDRLRDGASYRTASRALGAVVSEQALVHEGYRSALEEMLGLREKLRERAASVRYQTVPPYFRRIEEQIHTPTVAQVAAAFGG
ncbi:hypothetical protein [Rhodocaloribacter sp.]